MVSPSGMRLRGYGGGVHADLAALVGADHVERDAVLEDASGLRGTVGAVVAPADAAQVAAVVAWCYERDVAMIPVGGRSGYSGGIVPARGRGEGAVDPRPPGRIPALNPPPWGLGGRGRGPT